MTHPGPSFSIDRLADAALRLLALFSWLLLAAFLVVVLTATHARAEDASCGGKDLLAEMAKTDPEKLADMRKEADAIENGKSILWKIEKPGVKPSWLYGTMHLTDPRVLKLSDTADTAYKSAGTVVIETDEVLDPQAPLKVMANDPQLMMFTDDTTLEKLIPQDKLEGVKAGLTAHGLSLAALNKMQPWIVSSMLAMSACEMERTKSGAAFLDIKLARDAKAEGKEVTGLETIKDQLGAMASLPLKFHVEGLIEALNLGPKLPDLFETMTILYMRGDIGMIVPLMRSVSPDGSMKGETYGDFEEKMINARNRVMTDHAAPIIDKGNVFIAVGALHLPGDKGLVTLLRGKGYTVTAQ
ncbi:polysaccharide biosynthesis protein GumN [Phyllobacterium sp. 628]|uniref:TraB/GumN family protein n=1 Tax=Phyllobacterium sp. 628 TaxID=2718938 RepID=UPI0016624474|nr:TraB/GumN family protein [Phyllobacterium sp. 628]QND51135.1 polysaccharide biosynthesis protein GumN [Phyllobacterium sp. 628]